MGDPFGEAMEEYISSGDVIIKDGKITRRGATDKTLLMQDEIDILKKELQAARDKLNSIEEFCESEIDRSYRNLEWEKYLLIKRALNRVTGRIRQGNR